MKVVWRCLKVFIIDIIFIDPDSIMNIIRIWIGVYTTHFKSDEII